MKSYRCDVWSRVVGADVEIHKNGQVVRAGIVETVMPDDTILWMATDHNGNRALFEAAEGYEVWADPHDLLDQLYTLISSQQLPTTLVSDTDLFNP
ncbi:hypothetical protein QF038_001911 [Pseudarthrobacter sp. W1I19]|uniref:hypothetical protein n=1 Tax=Pseudarthrobacter sp. W1I19 TaxID=3042288 RepID=UPI00277D6A09|nr:hypothetical protein [Pseudarthrobacter sp. W1I19]MDQ0923403.1 hypothetical protein [Pseudarthrobacter sp. W1I19]